MSIQVSWFKVRASIQQTFWTYTRHTPVASQVFNTVGMRIHKARTVRTAEWGRVAVENHLLLFVRFYAKHTVVFYTNCFFGMVKLGVWSELNLLGLVEVARTGVKIYELVSVFK
jgi:hypothetical protein